MLSKPLGGPVKQQQLGVQDGFDHYSDMWTAWHMGRVVMNYHEFVELSQPELEAVPEEHFREYDCAAMVAPGESWKWRVDLMTQVQRHTLAHSVLVYWAVPAHGSHWLNMPVFPSAACSNLFVKHALVDIHRIGCSWNPGLVLLYIDPGWYGCRHMVAGSEQTKNNLVTGIAPVSPPYYMQLGLGKMKW